MQVGIDQVEAGEYTTYTEETVGDLAERIKAQDGSRDIGKVFAEMASEEVERDGLGQDDE
jgi:hypothetical protein